jgi:hypothetical protein
VRNIKIEKIIFISLAEDTPEQLKSFLVKNHFPIVVPNMKDYMNLTLQLNAFPTHILLLIKTYHR